MPDDSDSVSSGIGPSNKNKPVLGNTPYFFELLMNLKLKKFFCGKIQLLSFEHCPEHFLEFPYFPIGK